MVKAILLTSKSCPHCSAFKERNKEAIASGEIKVVEFEDNRELFMKIAKAFNVNAVPTVLGVVEQDGKKKLCELNFEKKEVGECKEVEGVEIA
jgi:glutaredoxin